MSVYMCGMVRVRVCGHEAPPVRMAEISRGEAEATGPGGVLALQSPGIGPWTESSD